VPKPVLLTVDDDPSVSRAVARDLRRRYGEHYRVLRAESGAQALEALDEVKLRGEAVAVILADHRMPEMNGVQFLEQAMDRFPRARRALLTAYADTDAAISAINVVDVDHYLGNGCWSRSATPAPASPSTSTAASSSRSSPPNLWARAPASGSTSPGGSW